MKFEPVPNKLLLCLRLLMFAAVGLDLKRSKRQFQFLIFSELSRVMSL